MLRRFVLVALGATAVSIIAPTGAPGQGDNFPNNTVKIVVPTAPGGPLDVLGRLMTQRLRDIWGQPVIIENRPGGALMVGANAVAKSPPDGYTLLLSNDGPVTINPSLYKSMPYDPKKELAPITQVVDAPFILVVNPNVQAKTVAELIAYAKANPGKINFASGGNTSRLAGELFRLSAGIEIVNVPYNGSGQAILGVVGGDVHMMIDGITSSLPQVMSGKLRALGVGTKGRLKEVPGVPAIAEKSSELCWVYVAWFVRARWHAAADRQQDSRDVRCPREGTRTARSDDRPWHVSGGQHASGVRFVSGDRRAPMGASYP